MNGQTDVRNESNVNVQDFLERQIHVYISKIQKKNINNFVTSRNLQFPTFIPQFLFQSLLNERQKNYIEH